MLIGSNEIDLFFMWNLDSPSFCLYLIRRVLLN